MMPIQSHSEWLIRLSCYNSGLSDHNGVPYKTMLALNILHASWRLWIFVQMPFSGRKRVLIGIMSSKLYLPTRGKAIQSSWLNEVDHRLADVKFFADYTEGYSTVQLPKVNDSQYPPQRKSFSMLAYYHDHQIENYDWFIRMDDDSVLQWDNLNEFLDRD